MKKYKLIVYTNFIENINNNNIELRQYYDNSEKNRYNNNWLNLSYNKINCIKYRIGEKEILYFLKRQSDRVRRLLK